jgi:hypothetical protein
MQFVKNCNMGNTCCSLQVSDTRQIALKLPHGPKGVAWTRNKFQPVDINDWLKQLYANSSWHGYICYNDELPQGHHTTRGHCKGILAWNETRIGWLIHSVPKFPETFTGNSISPMGPSELIYGQSFLYVEQSRSVVQLDNVLKQIFWMKPNLFHVHNLPPLQPYPSHPLEIKTLQWSKTMIHLAKSPDHATDFIGTELCKLSKEPWHQESWKRGSHYSPQPMLHSIKTLCISNTPFLESQDHSKWAFTTHQLWIGDLNHMRSQEKRGGGGMVIQSSELAAAFRGFVSTQT